MSNIAVQLLVWNGLKYLPGCFESLFKQTLKDFSLFVLDNDSHDGSREWLRQAEQSGRYPFTLKESEFNSGFAPGHNQLFSLHQAPYVLLLNQDIILEPDYLERLRSFLEQTPQAAAVSGVLYRWRKTPDENPVIDSWGLRILQSGRVIELGQGENTAAVPLRPAQVFGVSGALPLYRRQALVEAADLPGEIFDGSFFAYKEDVDLAYRLRLSGWQAWVVPEARAWHDRTVAGKRELGDLTALKNRRGRHDIARRYSYRNHLLVLYKDVPLEVWRRFWYKIGWYEAKKFIYLLVTEPAVWWFAWRELAHLASWRKKRRRLQRTRRVTAKEIRIWYTM